LATPLALTDQQLAQPEQRSTYREGSFRRGIKRGRRTHEVLATVAHELRNPLGAVMNSLAVLRLAQSDPGLVERTLATVERQGLRMKRMIDDLLDVSRIAQDRLEIRKTRVSLGLILVQAAEPSRSSLEERGQTLSVTPLTEPVFLDADPMRLSQVFENLLDNASKYSDRGGHIDVTVERQGLDVVVRVADNGIGIPPSLLTKVFERFVQLDRSRARAQGGLGVGLAVAKQLVELHGGTIIARSEGPGRGSEFVVRLVALPAARVIDPAIGRQERGAPLLSSQRELHHTEMSLNSDGTVRNERVAQSANLATAGSSHDLDDAAG
jgi:signal transduction histidine kinase